MTPKQVYERQLHLALTGDRVAQLELYALDAVVEAPFAPAGVPNRFEGRDQILAMSLALDAARPADLRIVEGLSHLVVHETVDPEVVIAEVDAIAELPSADLRVQVRQVHIVRVRDGQIIHMKDYYASGSMELIQRALDEGNGLPK